ncbi:MAG: hypothetical protein PHV36_10560 [Elusimicrobiales bacterium]|nr:hypothetical protein [Elusimicrobiales bacterium]
MKRITINALALILLSANCLYAGTVPVPQKATPVFDCPQASEKAEDCPWAGAARLLDAKAGGKEDLAPVFAAHAPGILKQLDADRSNTAALSLWGESINFDEMANGIIVHNEILGFLSTRLGVAQPKGKIVHAGMEHTYGYLFSLLPTKFGFKRARWVRPDIEEGLGLPRGSAGPSPSEGTLLANVSCLAGGIALKDDQAASALLERAKPFCAAALRNYSPARRLRLTEEVALPGGRKVALRTDFVPFLKKAGGNSHLLVYSFYDSAAKRAFLVTAFPVNEEFVERTVAPSGLGEGKAVQTRYNAHVEGFTGAGSFKGKRSVTVVGK